MVCCTEWNPVLSDSTNFEALIAPDGDAAMSDKINELSLFQMELLNYSEYRAKFVAAGSISAYGALLRSAGS